MHDASLKGRNIVVTGAGMGLGAAYAAAAAAAGANVVVADIKSELAQQTVDGIEQAGGRAIPYVADVSDWDQAAAMVQACVEEFGAIDGLVNNAGIIGLFRPMLEETEAVARKTFDVNVFGTMFAGTHAARAMVAAGRGGAIVNVSSGNQMGTELLSVYGASKAAAAGLTYTWAMELAEFNIRVNAISPNAHTNQIDEAIAQLGHNPEQREYPAREDNAAVMTYLLSDAAHHITGQVVRVDHGYVSITSHPLVITPNAQIDGRFTVDSVAEAFEQCLAGQLQPLGIHRAEITLNGAVH